MTPAYQVARHLAAHLRQWPHCNRNEVAQYLRRSVATGNAWHYPEPVQIELPFTLPKLS